ncbi:hypothetical protein V8B55DRAFT_1572013 [Mucor lusitanicus]
MTSNNPNNNHNWSDLPSLILCNILHYAQRSSKLELQNNAALLSACQLVCKGWSQAAQEALYKQVHLGSNTLHFLNTIADAKKLGDFVRILVIEQGILDLGDVFDFLEDIITHCPNIEEIYSFEQAVRNDVWTYLTSFKKAPQHLKAFTTATSDAASSPLYSPLALRFEETLTHMQINVNTALSSNTEQGFHSLLSKRLNHFVSLQQLRVDHWRVKSWQDFDTFLNRCSTTLRELVLVHLDMSSNRFPPEYKFTQNTNVKFLKIGASDVPAATLQYLKSKMAALEKFDLLFVTFPDGSPHDASIWWAYLMEMCKNLTSYNIKFAHSNYQDISIAKLHEILNTKKKTVCLAFNTSQEEDNVIALSKSWQTYTIHLEYDNVGYLELISQWMGIYLPHYIRIEGKNMDSQYQTITIIDAAQTQEATRSLLERMWNHGNLRMFFTALSFVTGKNVTALHFDSIILYCTYLLGNSTLSNLQVSSLKFSKSILHHRALECISRTFVKISKLTLDTCCILMDNPFQLNVRLPFTEMTALELSVNPFINATSWSPHKKQMYSNCCNSLENLCLQRAVAEDGHLMVKIETQDKTHIFHKQGAGDIKKSCINPNCIESNAFNFVIWIECKQLEQVRIRGGEHGLKWNVNLLE